MTADANVECAKCGRFARCAIMRDGTLYRPFAWTFPHEDPFLGICPDCQPSAVAPSKGQDAK